ncbi:hypothetical protein QH494_16030 [Sphingomonas sp. AR_OL41]|uniref:hypothetical protein n=1 Tax=Sphingomonas sp. AR_OL41 TaxID=3042729 RepID=UPI002480E4D0|nr:hypothetical protein [Sphingomonas sp. AR_OL41]MDH7973701.1 hypothetical protein [Sphingomonas sp. AR_OL41]
MTVSDLMQAMADAGAPLEAILLAVRALEAKDGEIAARRKNDRERKQRQRRNVAGQSRDIPATVPATVTATPPDKKVSPDPFKELTPPTPDEAEASSTPARGRREDDDRKIGKADQRPPARPKRTGKRKPGSRLAANWEPPAIDTLSLAVQSVVAQWPAGAYALVAQGFRNHWLSEGRAVAAKRDWPKTWENWLVREAAQVLRSAKAGVRFDGASSGEAAPVDAQVRFFEQSALTYDRIGRADDAEAARAAATALRAGGAGGGVIVCRRGVG